MKAITFFFLGLAIAFPMNAGSAPVKTRAMLKARALRSAPIRVACSKTHCFLFRERIVERGRERSNELQLLQIIVLDRLIQARLENALSLFRAGLQQRQRDLIKNEILDAIRAQEDQRRDDHQNRLLNDLLRSERGSLRESNPFPSQSGRSLQVQNAKSQWFLVEVTPIDNAQAQVQPVPDQPKVQPVPEQPVQKPCPCPNCGTVIIIINGQVYRKPHVEEEVKPNANPRDVRPMNPIPNCPPQINSPGGIDNPGAGGAGGENAFHSFTERNHVARTRGPKKIKALGR